MTDDRPAWEDSQPPPEDVEGAEGIFPEMPRARRRAGGREGGDARTRAGLRGAEPAA